MKTSFKLTFAALILASLTACGSGSSGVESEQPATSNQQPATSNQIILQ